MKKTNRATLESLVLVNWKGFFYQPFEMDKGVTALEGENGAGKTTVMIAAFVALLPDQRLLQFRNVSEAGGMEGDRGIYGRLGERGVAYTVMELRVSRTGRMLAGVMLRKKAPPSLELTPFIAGGLPDGPALDEILLVRDGESERVPEMAEIRQKLGQMGCTLDVYDSVAQYTSTLFDLGVVPMRMEAYAERDKFNRMLQTSMYGGLSNAIQRGLRDYLLAEDHSLRNHVARMRENLDACRVTRREIESAESRYKIIEGVFRSGYGMFESAFHGTRLRMAGLRKRADAARTDHFRCKSEVRELENRWHELRRVHTALELELGERQEVYAGAEELLRVRREARNTAVAIESHSAACLAAKEESERTGELFRRTEKRYREGERLRDRLLVEKEEIAAGLADASRAWEQVSMKVALLRQARQTLEDTRTAFPDRSVDGENAGSLLTECIEQWDRAIAKKTRIKRELDLLDARLRSYKEVLDALREGLLREVAPEDALDAAREFDAGFREMESLVKEAETLPGRIEHAVKMAERRQAVLRRLPLLEKRGEKISSADDLRSCFQRLQEERDSLAEERSTLQERRAVLREESARDRELLGRLKAEAEEWRQARALIRRLEEGLKVRIEDGPSLEGLDRRLRTDLEAERERLRDLSEARDAAREKTAALEFGGGRIEESLVRLRDQVDGFLAADLYDDTPEEDAPRIEARLGPLHGAILVEDIFGAAERISQEPELPDHVWLMEAGALGELPEGSSFPGAELVKTGDAWRLSRHPERPVVGRASREREIERLKAHADVLTKEMEKGRGLEARLIEGIETVGTLRRFYRLIGSPDPGEPLQRLQNRMNEIQEEDLRVQRRMTESAARLQQCREMLQVLGDCLPDAGLMDEDNWSDTVAALRGRLGEADAVRLRMEAARSAMERVRLGMLDLESPPPGPEEVESRKEAGRRADAVLEYWSRGRELLSMLVDRLPHLEYADQEKLLIEQKSALTALQGKKEEADRAYQAARAEVDCAAEELERARSEFSAADARFRTLHEKIESLRGDLARSGQDGTLHGLVEAERSRDEAVKKLNEARKAERDAGNDSIRAEKDMEMGRERTAEVRERRKRDIEDLWPHWRTWTDLRRRARLEGFLERLMDPRVLRNYEQKTVPRAFEDASRHQGELKNILKTFPEGDALREEVEQRAETPDSDLKRGAQNLEAWVAIRRFLERSIPRDIAQADDPEIALTTDRRPPGGIEEQTR